MTLGYANSSWIEFQKHGPKKEKTDKLNLIKIKNFHILKDNIMKMKKQATDQEKNTCTSCI